MAGAVGPLAGAVLVAGRPRGARGRRGRPRGLRRGERGRRRQRGGGGRDRRPTFPAIAGARAATPGSPPRGVAVVGAGVRAEIGCVGAVGPAARDADGVAMGRSGCRRAGEELARRRAGRSEGARAAGVAEAAASDATGWTTGASVCADRAEHRRERLRHRGGRARDRLDHRRQRLRRPRRATGVSGCATAAASVATGWTTGDRALRHRRGERRGRLRHRRDRLARPRRAPERPAAPPRRRAERRVHDRRERLRGAAPRAGATAGDRAAGPGRAVRHRAERPARPAA